MRDFGRWDGAQSSDTASALEVAEWDWLRIGSGQRLHYGAEYDADPAEFWSIGWARGRTACGRTGDLFIPGVLSRMGLARCARCCALMGIPRGIGSPKNDKGDLRLWVETRVAAILDAV